MTEIGLRLWLKLVHISDNENLSVIVVLILNGKDIVRCGQYFIGIP